MGRRVTQLADPPTGVGELDEPAPVERRDPAGQLVARFGLAWLLGLVIVGFSVWPRTSSAFLSRANIDNILADQTIVTMMALAFMAPLITGALDLSVGAATGVSAVAVATSLHRFELPVVVAIVAALACCLAIALVNGVGTAYLGLHPAIFTLAVATVLGGLVQWYTRGLSISGRSSDTLITIGSDTWLTIPVSTYLLAATAVVMWYLLEHTRVGRHMRAVGINPEAARLVGIDVARTKMLAFIVWGVLAGLAGVVLVARNGASNPGDGPGMLFAALGAVFLGSTAIRPGQFNVGGTVLGVFFVACVVSGLNLAGVDPWVQPVINGASLAAAITISTLGQRRAN
jgi:ribose transport system permease protein